jgi:hypothetical protein
MKTFVGVFVAIIVVMIQELQKKVRERRPI